MPGNKISQVTARWSVLLGAVLWGTIGAVTSFAPESAGPLTIGAMRLLIGGTGLLLLAAKFGSLKTVKGLSVISTIIAAAGLAAYQPFFFSGIAKTGVAVGTVVTIGSSPIIAGILGIIIRRERPQGRWWTATALSVLGCAVLVSNGNSVSVNLLGVALSLGAGFGYALYSVVIKQLMDNRESLAVVAVVNSTAALMLVPVLVTGNLSWLAQPRGIIVALYLGLFACTAAYFLFSRGLAVLPVATAVTLSLSEPLTAALLGILLLGEQLTLPVFLGIGLLMAGLGVLSLNPGGCEFPEAEDFVRQDKVD